ncbi:MAG TPA: hypothetical protein VNU68_27145 [Verrucomicrobiae bacterium]|nr:hypothetical protein [Verrucomicrobiae bacterium]
MKPAPAFLMTSGLRTTPWGRIKQIKQSLEHGMITLGPLLVFLVATALPVIFLLLASRWIEAHDRKGNKKRQKLHGVSDQSVGRPRESQPAPH